MQIIDNIQIFLWNHVLLPSVFDGVHLGHRFLIEQVKELAKDGVTFCINHFSGSSTPSDEV